MENGNKRKIMEEEGGDDDIFPESGKDYKRLGDCFLSNYSNDWLGFSARVPDPSGTQEEPKTQITFDPSSKTLKGEVIDGNGQRRDFQVGVEIRSEDVQSAGFHSLSSSASTPSLTSSLPSAFSSVPFVQFARLRNKSLPNVSERIIAMAPSYHDSGLPQASEADKHKYYMPNNLAYAGGVFEKLHQMPFVQKSLPKKRRHDPNEGFVMSELLFGGESPVIKEERVATVQGLSETGTLRLGAAVIQKCFPSAKVLIPSPTSGKYKSIFNDAGVELSEYKYYDPKTGGLDFEGMISGIKEAREGSFIFLHGCAHYPTGIDPTPQQWKIIADVIQENNHIPYFHIAYQGLANGSLAGDAAAVRMFVAPGRGMEVFASQSYMIPGRYARAGASIGAFNVVCSLPDDAASINHAYTFAHHGFLVDEGEDPAEKNCLMGIELLASLSAKDGSGKKDWSIVVKQKGMFFFTGFNKAQCDNMKSKWDINFPEDGIINLEALPLTKMHMDYVANAIIDSYHNVGINAD
ncbi:Aspartate/other aminotransferase [Corchorus olitorius]|uniref:Aspartate/other aminotransferase n=1 Tax=Corchorus olitorius TaxID=93759 RepID=A0A1R3KX88_9ROSI|nr:Aspartate/other aminotransferase [Corchorus olitorius]